jgi:DNA-binding transcriptional ArsR family regulator
MISGPLIAEIAALVGEPARATMLSALLDGRALTASELAFAARVTPQTASTHLAKLTEAGSMGLWALRSKTGRDTGPSPVKHVN